MHAHAGYVVGEGREGMYIALTAPCLHAPAILTTHPPYCRRVHVPLHAQTDYCGWQSIHVT